MMGAGEGRTILAGKPRSKPTIANREFDVFKTKKQLKGKYGICSKEWLIYFYEAEDHPY